MIQLQALGLQLGSKILLEKADLTVYPGQKWGIIGANGSGKSSLFKLLLGELQPDSGSLSIPRDWILAHMAQEVGHQERRALDYVIDGDEGLRELEALIVQETDGEELARLYGRLEAIDGYTADARAQKLLRGLGFSATDAMRNVTEFSGGWRIRLNLARALMCRSDLLLLDEPTNHLDLDATVWLEQWLKQYSGTLLIVSHDRDFLDNVVGNIVNFENTRLISYSGNYSAYERQKAERLANQAAAFAKQQERIAEIEDFVRRFRAKASKAKQAQSRLKELERMEKIAPAHIDSPFNFRFPEPDRVPQQLLNFAEANIGYGQKTVLQQVNINIFGQSRIGLLGHNGAGKSTFIKALTGSLPLVSGERVESPHLKIGYFAQHQLEALDLDASCALHLQRLRPSASEQEIRNFLGSFDFRGDRAFECIRHFSGGEKARLALAILAWQKPNLLVLDEPTNHLDLEVRHALTVALQAFAGAIVVVSHDRHLLRNTVDEFWLIDSGKVQPFAGDLQDYQVWMSGAKTTAKEVEAKPTTEDKSVDKKAQRQSAAASREKLKPFTQAIKQLEQKIDAAQKRLSQVEEKLAQPELYESAGGELQKLLKEQGTIRQELSELEEAWLEKTEELEQLQQSL
ncbi:ATP-binding cassette domain-containing protein [Saccharophagus sp. K07]|uniref:ATP-binding cassette domain-containing protein n=1 Tax=Saccharophagus sp. K07 TaxID=2283636 RepID=UPI001652A756|nr:ATP-binding cassette domain-containing protein [Saccharophagus sp. K07]MBC6904730.1 ATP-binding cassette domain-containing protein [Saccharophagus sp. K07]